VLIKQDNNVFTEDKVNCDASSQSIMDNLQCTIPVSVLTAAPYSLIWGSTIKVKVYAYNVIGSTGATEFGTAKITNVPESPRYINSDPSKTNASTIGITWSDGDSNGGLTITSY